MRIQQEPLTPDERQHLHTLLVRFMDQPWSKEQALMLIMADMLIQDGKPLNENK